MLDVNEGRAVFAEYLAANAGRKKSLDAALMAVIEWAYRRGTADATATTMALATEKLDSALNDINTRVLFREAPGIHARHEANDLARDAARYRWLRERDLDTIFKGGVFAGKVPDNLVLNGSDLDNAIDSAMSTTPNAQVQGRAGSLARPAGTES